MAEENERQNDKVNVRSITLTDGTILKYGFTGLNDNVSATGAATTIVFAIPAQALYGIELDAISFGLTSVSGSPTGLLQVNVGNNNGGGNNNIMPNQALPGLLSNFWSYTYHCNGAAKSYPGDNIRVQVTDVLSSGVLVVQLKGNRFAV